MALTLAQIDSAIADVLSIGQSVTHDGTTMHMADLDKLYKMRESATAEENRSGTRPTMRGFNFNSMGY